MESNLDPSDFEQLLNKFRPVLDVLVLICLNNRVKDFGKKQFVAQEANFQKQSCRFQYTVHKLLTRMSISS